MNLHRGSRGTAVKVLETRLARLYLLPTSAVDRRYRAATVNSVRHFQWRIGLPVTGRVNRRTWNLVAGEAARRAAAPAPKILGHRGQVTSAHRREHPRGDAVRRAARQHAGVRPPPDGRPRARADARPRAGPDDRTAPGRSPRGHSPTCAPSAGSVPRSVPTFDEVAAYAASVGKPIAPDLKDATMTMDDLAKVVSVIQAHGLARQRVGAVGLRQPVRGAAPARAAATDGPGVQGDLRRRAR